MAGEEGITKDFLEKALGFPVEKFEVKPGSSLGDGYTCVLHSVAVWRKSGNATENVDPLNIIIKCYPNNPTRQEFLESSNVFSQEVDVYSKIVPELYKFQEGLNLPEIVEPPFGKFIYGSYVGPEAKKALGRPLEIQDNCIIMPDLRTPENGGYRLRDRFLGLDLDHYKLAVEAHARVHALSWAYRCKMGLKSLAERFPSLAPKPEMAETFNSMGPFISSTFESARQMFPDNPRIIEALNYLDERYFSVWGLYFEMDVGQKEKGYTKDTIIRNPNQKDTEEPWMVLLHGDAWSNNMMFRYDEKTGRPVQCLLVDLQITREGDPMADLAYTLYCSTQKDLRSKHLTSMLHVYFDTFTQLCKRMSVPTLPGFTWEEFNRRFNRAKILGASFAVFALPIMLKNPEDLVDMDQLQIDESVDGTSKGAGETMGELLSMMRGTKSASSFVQTRLRHVLEDMIDDGIL